MATPDPPPPTQNILAQTHFPECNEDEVAAGQGLPIVKDVQNKAISLIAACLEGRREGANDAVVSGKLSDLLDAEMLLDFGQECQRRIEASTSDRSLDAVNLAIATASDTDSCVCLHTVLADLSLHKGFKKQVEALVDEESNDEPGPRRHLLATLKATVGEVEINWQGKIEKVSFPLKPDIHYLREGTKEHFMNTGGRGSEGAGGQGRECGRRAREQL